MAMADDEIKFREKLEKLGPVKVRRNLSLGRYGVRKARYAQAWLEEHDYKASEESEALKESSSAEQIRIARSAKNAAWTAAIAAIIAAISAIIALKAP